jgi:hypothetical protein
MQFFEQKTSIFSSFFDENIVKSKHLSKYNTSVQSYMCLDIYVEHMYIDMWLMYDI